MTEHYGFFDSIIDDERYYTADEYAERFRLVLTDGVINGGTNLQVVASGGDMTVDILDGFAWIKGYTYKVTEGHNLTITKADNLNDRIDRIVIRLDKQEQNRYIRAFVKEGVASESPQPPDLIRDEQVYELSLAQVRVKAGRSYISADAVTDERLNTEVCGLVNSLIQADTTEIFNQFQAWYNTKTPEFEQQWEEWLINQKAEGYVTYQDFQDLSDEIETDVAESMEKVEVALAKIENLSFESQTLKTVKSNKDSEGIYTTVSYYRKTDGTLYGQSVLSGGTSPRYTTRTLTFYSAEGQTIKTETYELTYDADGMLISEV